MSFGLKVLSASGKSMLDTSLGSMLLLDYIELPWTLSFSKQYPSLAGTHIIHTYHTDAHTVAYNRARPTIIAGMDVNGIPTVTVTPDPSTPPPDSSDPYRWYVLVYARPTSTVDSFGLLATGAADNVSLIAAGTKNLRFKGVINASPGDGPYADRFYEYDLASVGVSLKISPTPLLFLEMHPDHYVGIVSIMDFVSPDYSVHSTVQAIATPGFVPRLFVFFDDVAEHPIDTGSFGLAVYSASGEVVFHSGRDVAYLQTSHFKQLNPPIFPDTADTATAAEVATNAAAFYKSISYANVAGTYLSGVKPVPGGLQTGWIYAFPGQYGFNNPQLEYCPVIDTSLYSV